MFDEDDEDGELFRLERRADEAEDRGPRVDVPSVRDPSASLPDPSTVDPAVQRSFWMAVVYANVALMGVSLGLMLIGFRGQWRWGGTAVGIGVLAGVRVYQTYRAFEGRDRDADGSDADGSDDGGSDDGGSDDGGSDDGGSDGDGPSEADPADDDPTPGANGSAASETDDDARAARDDD